jgi:hypothetical protein
LPKVKDLGVTVVPEGFGPVGIGGGAACGCTITNPCLFFTRYCGWWSNCGPFTFINCTDCTMQNYSICGTTPGPQMTVLQQAPPTCSDCTTQNYSICGTTPNRGGGTCTDCTTQPYSICGTTPGQCTDCTTQPYSICGTTPGAMKCTDCTNIPYSICGTTPMQQQQPGLTQETIRQLRAHLEAQLAALQVHEKALGPQTEAEMQTREQELQQELERIRARREEMNRNKS